MSKQLSAKQAEQKTIFVLKVFIVIGLCLLLTGHILMEYVHLPEKMGVAGMVISASCIAFGLVFSLPTKMYLTFILVKRENNESGLTVKSESASKNNKAKVKDE
ncbi:hypothetical protein J7384_15020 [Endozoicomonas sp. G2_1]|uniref:hypothetical protein n=1 Tax=Endozoicomonas sp. G2_1 TaxID=2821091 RepID=UPI001ADCD693|nr:hypothetical protein [Endozoicomonas sp. G2_1]MBO9491678.1 hypothetical protein [Endozoicomonas sp. G2_1]